MWIDLNQLPKPVGKIEGIEIREATSDADVDAAVDLIAWRWDLPSEVREKLHAVTRAFEVGVPGGAVRCWIAWKNGTPVSKVVLNLASESAGLYGVATRPEARGLGLARRLTLEAFSTAYKEGYRLGILHSTPMAKNLYEKLGFREIAPFRLFAPPHSFHI
jgi:ribosomal protein S18 acetylase RimI-like enzyme